MMDMKEEELTDFLFDAYSSITKEIVDRINYILSSNA